MGVDVDEVGRRVEDLLDQLAAADPAIAHVAEQLVTEIVGLYGAGLRGLTDRMQASDPGALSELAEDELIAGLLSLHGLHPRSIPDRVRVAVDEIAPTVREQGGDVHLLEVDDHQAILEVKGGGCGCSAGTVRERVEAALRSAVPELEFVEVHERGTAGAGEGTGHTGGLIPLHALGSRPDLDLIGG